VTSIEDEAMFRPGSVSMISYGFEAKATVLTIAPLTAAALVEHWAPSWHATATEANYLSIE
jgi:hypothetical protein